MHGRLIILERLERNFFFGAIETKKANLNGNFVVKLWGGSKVKWECVDACNTTGGILCMWEEGFMDQVEVLKGQR